MRADNRNAMLEYDDGSERRIQVLELEGRCNCGRSVLKGKCDVRGYPSK